MILRNNRRGPSPAPRLAALVFAAALGFSASTASADSDSQGAVFEASVGSPYRLDFDSGWLPEASDLQFRAFFFASPGEAHARYAATFTASWDSAKAIPGATIPVTLSVVGNPSDSTWDSDGGLRFGARYKIDSEVGRVKVFHEDYVPYLPHMDFSWPCSVAPTSSLSLGMQSPLCSLEWGAGGNCLAFVGETQGTCYGDETFDPNFGIDFCLPLPEEPDVKEDPNDSTKVVITLRPYYVVAIDFGVSFGLCVEQRAGTKNLRDLGTGKTFVSESSHLNFAFDIPCELATSTRGSERNFDFDIGPMKIDGDVALALIVRVNPELAACFAETLELSISPNVGLCLEVPVQIPLADFDFNSVPLQYEMPIADPVVRNVKPASDVTTNFVDPIPVSWDTSWDLPNNPCNLQVHAYYRFTTPTVGNWTDINSSQPQANTGQADWDMSGNVFAGCRKAEVRIDLLDANGRFLANQISPEFFIDVDPPVVIALQPPPGTVVCSGALELIGWQLPTPSCGVLTPQSQSIFLEYPGVKPIPVASGLPGTQTSLVWNMPPNLPSHAAAAIVIEATDTAGNVGSARIEPIGVDQPADVTFNIPGSGQGSSLSTIFPMLGQVDQFDAEVTDTSLPGGPCAGASGGFEVTFDYRPQDGLPPIGELLPSFNGQPQTLPGIYPVDLAGPGSMTTFSFAMQPFSGAKTAQKAGLKLSQVDTLRAEVRSTIGLTTWRRVELLVSNSVLANAWSDQTAAVLADSNQGRGVAWVDLDGDSDPDLYITNAGSGANRVYGNDGLGGFIDWTADPAYSVLADAGNGQGTTVADLDGDYDADLFLTKVFSANRLFESQGIFVDATPAVLADAGGNGRAVSAADVDRDGDVDLYVANAGANHLYRNDGGGSFVEVTTPPADAPSLSLAPVWCDYDQDGDDDLFVTSRDAANRLLRNDGSFVFTDVAPSTPVELASTACTGAVWVDYDNDLDFDLYVCVEGGANLLFRNEGPPAWSFTDVTSVAGAVGVAADSRGVAAADFDLNGWVDLYLANAASVNVLLLNQNGIFGASSTGVLADSGGGQGVAAADYDGDGDEDIFLVNSGNPNRLFRNDQSTGHHWLQVDLRSPFLNRLGLGTAVEVYAGPTQQVRYVSSGTGLFSCAPFTLTFGLGSYSTADSLRIHWPDGGVEVVHSIPLGDRRLLWWGGGGGPVDNPPVVDVARNWLYPAVPNPFNPSTLLSFEIVRAGIASLTIYDIAGRKVRCLIDRTELGPGRHEATWHGRDDGGGVVSSGVYLYRVQTPGWQATRRMTLIK